MVRNNKPHPHPPFAYVIQLHCLDISVHLMDFSPPMDLFCMSESLVTLAEMYLF